ncbi:arginase family protein [Ciceribacter lividus]|uniref:Arginase family protein n=1 Tax=Ciceribacter lividus TaxID=1197950 RepID=A0A6I7HNN0_9HYPH|nr:arginase family protein [Ciceribacter lividus]RCW23343.1 arginase family protein [Ciceribacter lividus]
MFKVRLGADMERLSAEEFKLAGKPSKPLPGVLKPLAFLSHEWCSINDLRQAGVCPESVEALIRTGVLSFGIGRETFPHAARAFYETQFPVHAAAFPLLNWLEGPLPINTIWIGLPLCHLTNIRHSTATGLASVLDGSNGSIIPLLGIFPFMNPTEKCLEYLHRTHTLACDAGKRLGALGGDHRVAWALLEAVRRSAPADLQMRYIHIDAHHDLYGSMDNVGAGNVAHSNFLLKLLANGTIDEAVLIGCRDDPVPINQILERGFGVASVADYSSAPKATRAKHYTHLSIDLDIIDPSIIPDVSSPLAGGWSVQTLKTTIRDILVNETIDSVSLVEPGMSTASAVIAKDILEALSG